MALVLRNRVLETCTSPGTGAVTLLGATTGYQTFSAGVGNTNTCYYTIADQNGPNWEVGVGTYATAGNTLTRTTVLSSSNAGSLTNFSSGTQNVFVSYPSEKSVNLDASNNLTVLNTTYLGGASGNQSLQVNNVASAVNYLQVVGAVTTGQPTLSAQGTDTNIQVNFSAKGLGGFGFYAAGGTPQLYISPTASAVNYLQVTGSATGVAGPTLSAQGTDTNINVAVTPKGTGLLTVGDPTLPAGTSVLLNALFSSDTATGNVFSVRKSAATTAGANIAAFRSRGTAAAPTALASADNISSLLSSGFDGTNYLTAASIIVAADGAVSAGVMPGRISFLTNNGTTNAERGRVDSAGNWYFGGVPGANSLQVNSTASAVNYVQVAGAATGNSPSLTAAGSDTNIGLLYSAKGASGHSFFTGGYTQFLVAHVATAVNYLQVTGSATGQAVSLGSAGSDTNIDLALTPQGTGVVKFGTYTAGIIAQAGYITIKDAGGTSRRLLVG